MTKSKYKIITAVLYFIAVELIASVSYIVYFIFGLSPAETSGLHIWLLVAAVLIIASVFLFFRVVNTSETGQRYTKEYKAYKSVAIADQSMDEITGTDYYSYLPLYEGKNTFAAYGIFMYKALAYPYALMMLWLLYLCIQQIINDGNYFPLILLSLLFTIPLISYSLSLDRAVTINEQGVKLTHEKSETNLILSWDEIKTIGISVSTTGRRVEWGFIYITTNSIKENKVIPKYVEDSSIIVLKYRPKVIHCLLKYWDKEIKNLDAMKSWKRYVNRL